MFKFSRDTTLLLHRSLSYRPVEDCLEIGHQVHTTWIPRNRVPRCYDSLLTLLAILDIAVGIVSELSRNEVASVSLDSATLLANAHTSSSIEAEGLR